MLVTRMSHTKKRVLLGFAIAYRIDKVQGFNDAGKLVYVRAAITLGPEMIQADDLPPELARSIESFLQKHIEEIDE